MAAASFKPPKLREAAVRAYFEEKHPMGPSTGTSERKKKRQKRLKQTP
jgi:hypothetical protein